MFAKAGRKEAHNFLDGSHRTGGRRSECNEVIVVYEPR